MENKGKTLRSRLLAPMAVILLLQTVLLTLFYQFGGVVDSLEESTVRAFVEDAENEKLNIERELLQRWLSGIDDTEALAYQIETVLRREHKTPADIRTDSDLNSKIIQSVVGQLITRLHRSYGNGIFLILDGPASRNGAPSEQAGIAIRDLDSNSFAPDNSDLLLERGLPSLSNEFKIALDSDWELGFDFTEIEDQSFYSVPFSRAADHFVERERLAEYSYIGTSDLNPKDNIRMLSYSVPLVLTDGTVVGVIGVELAERSIRQFLNANMKDSNQEILNVLARVDGESRNITPVIVGSARFPFYFGTEGELSFEKSPWENVYSIKDQEGRLWYGAAEPLNIYGRRTAFDGGAWICLRLQQKTRLFFDIKRVGRMLWVSAAVSFFATIAALYLGGDVLTEPVKKLLAQLRLAESNEGVRLNPVGILEIDELVGAINRLNEGAERNAAKIAGILELFEMEAGLFEESKDSDRVFCSRSLLKLLELPCGDALYEYIDRDTFFFGLSKLCNPVEEEEGTLYEYPQGDSLRYIRMKYIGEETEEGSGILIDVTKEICERKKTDYERNHDFLTGLYNRRRFHEKVELLMKQNKKRTAAMVVWDLDNLKYVNDTYGHEVGDRYICLFADCLREQMPEGAIMERRSGDEFSAYIWQGEEPEIWNRLLNFMESLKDVTLTVTGDYQIPLRASAGLVWYPRQADDFDTLMRYADFAMYMAKHSIKGTTREFELESYQENFYLLSGLEELNRMLENGNVGFAMQPIVTRAGRIYGYELLMRPELEVLGSITELLHLARMQAKLPQIEALTWDGALQWVSEREAQMEENSRFFINSIANVALTPEIVEKLEERYPELLNRLVVEMTETECSDQSCMQHKIGVTRRWNAMLALDDYGTGYNGEGMLLQLKPDIVKLDILLVRNIQNSENQQMIVKNLIDYCKAQNILILAEGVETKEELTFLLKMGVDLFQGFYLARPSKELLTIDPDIVRDMQEISEEEPESPEK